MLRTSARVRRHCGVFAFYSLSLSVVWPPAVATFSLSLFPSPFDAEKKLSSEMDGEGRGGTYWHGESGWVGGRKGAVGRTLAGHWEE